ncbi:hypothetical protein HNR01_004063 [Methylorubrum rhodesianum]|nr:hypothetical protein [Methylorubrum rhodesianum]
MRVDAAGGHEVRAKPPLIRTHHGPTAAVLALLAANPASYTKPLGNRNPALGTHSRRTACDASLTIVIRS